MKDTDIAARLQHCLSRIRQANGFETDIGALIKYGSRAQVEQGTLYLSDEEEDEVVEQKKHSHRSPAAIHSRNHPGVHRRNAPHRRAHRVFGSMSGHLAG